MLAQQVEKWQKALIKKGEKIGLEKARKRAIAKRKKLAFEKGIKLGITSAARKMLDLGWEIELIAKCTGLSLEEIEKLKA